MKKRMQRKKKRRSKKGRPLHHLPQPNYLFFCYRGTKGCLHSTPSSSVKIMELYEKDSRLLTMHDLVHDLARSVICDELLVVGKGENIGSCYHYALLNDCSKALGLESSKIRALRFVECGQTELQGVAIPSSKSMRVLDLNGCSIHKLPDSIGVLKQLRYLNAPRVQDATIPDSITKLSKLIYLNLCGSSRILALPESIGDIEGLVHLDLSGCSRIRNFPESFRRLKELVHLDLSNCSCVGGISALLGSLTQLKYLNLSYCPNIGELPETLGGLSNLQYLNLSYSSYLECCQEAEVLEALTKLEYLNISSRYCALQKLPEALGGFIQLKYLNLSGCMQMEKMPRLFGSLANLAHLDLSKCHVYPLDEALVGLTNLQYLNLNDTYLTSLPGDLTKLRYLNLSKLRCTSQYTLVSLINHICTNLSDLEHLDLSDLVITSIPESLCSLRKLHTLDLSNCRFLQEIPENIGTIDSLKFLYLNGCEHISEPPQLGSSVVSLPHFAVQASNGDSGSNLVQLQHTDPVELHITKLENVKSAGEAHFMELKEKQSLENLKLKWTGGAKRFVDDKMVLAKLVPPSTLKKLEICGYNGVSFPSWPVCQLPNLLHLVFRRMANLVEWNTSTCGEEHMFRRFEIHDCPMLRMTPLPPRAAFLEISNSDNVLSSWEECTMSHTNVSYSSPVRELRVNCSKVPLYQWRLLQHLPGLYCLTINNCSDLTISPEIIQRLSSLYLLFLVHLEELPKWSNELTPLRLEWTKEVGGITATLVRVEGN